MIYTTDQDELLEAVGCSNEKFWKYLSLDDWDYAIVIDGHITPKNLPVQLLVGCCSNEWQYFKDEDKTVGMAYHA